MVQPSTITFNLQPLRWVAATGFLICSCDIPTSGTGSNGSPSEHQVRLTGVEVDRFDGQTLGYRVRFERADVDRETREVRGHVITARAVDDGTTVRAPKLRSTLGRRVVHLFGGVVAEDALGRVLRADSLTYDAQQDRITTSAPVRLEGQNFVAIGGAVSGQPKAGRLEIAGPISATVSPGKDAL